MATLRIIDDLSAPCLYHADKDIGILCSTDSFGREHLGIVAADVFYDLQRFARVDIDQFADGLGGYLVAILIDKVACMDKELRLAINDSVKKVVQDSYKEISEEILRRVSGELTMRGYNARRRER